MKNLDGLLRKFAPCALLLLVASCQGGESVQADPNSNQNSTLQAASSNSADSPKVTAAVTANLGYTDTPLLPGSMFRVHDGERPQPTMIYKEKSTLPPSTAVEQAPTDAFVLFSGANLDAWTSSNGPARWKHNSQFMEVNGTGDLRTRRGFGDVQLHLEFRTPEKVVGDSQGRGNSGVFLMDRYEVQILDSWHNPTYPDGQAAAIYGQHPPIVNASFPPGSWQSYDIVFTAPKFNDNGLLLSPARATVLHNGVLVQNNVILLGPTRHRNLPEYQEHADEAPIRLQDHGNPVQFRNIWVRELKSANDK